MTITKLSEELRNDIARYLDSHSIEIEYSYDDCLSNDQIEKLFEEDGLIDLENELLDHNIDYIFDLEHDALKYVLEEHRDQLEDELLEDESDELDYDDLARDLRDKFLDHLGVDTNIKALIPSYIPVRIEMYSNYDCINSHWFESQGGYYYKDSYFGAIVDNLNLNPAKVEEIMGFEFEGVWPDLEERNGKEYVDYKEFSNEIINSCCGANLLTVLATVDYDMIQKGFGKIVIPKGNPIGFYSSMQGGGSIFDCPLIRDMEIDLNAKGLTEYDHWGLSSDTNEYSIQRVFGSDSSMFGDGLK